MRSNHDDEQNDDGCNGGEPVFSADHLAKSDRELMLQAVEMAGMDAVALTPQRSKTGAVETREESKRCAELFKRNQHRLDGIIVAWPNFGEERAIADTLRLVDLRMPVLTHATSDDVSNMGIACSRDSFAERCQPVITCVHRAFRILWPHFIPKLLTRLSLRRICSGLERCAA